VKIMGRASVDRDVVQGKLLPVLNASSLFINEMFDELWQASLFFGVDPVVTVAQSYKETGGGRFGGKVQAWMCNPCGLKVRDVEAMKKAVGTTDGDHMAVHDTFPNWQAGAIAQVQHLRAYAGVYLPADSLILSARYDYVVQANATRGVATDVEQLSGRWAPSATYGQEVVAIARKLGYTG
jgi:hypothetical protein